MYFQTKYFRPEEMRLQIINFTKLASRERLSKAHIKNIYNFGHNGGTRKKKSSENKGKLLMCPRLEYSGIN